MADQWTFNERALTVACWADPRSPGRDHGFPLMQQRSSRSANRCYPIGDPGFPLALVLNPVSKLYQNIGTIPYIKALSKLGAKPSTKAPSKPGTQTLCQSSPTLNTLALPSGNSALPLRSRCADHCCPIIDPCLLIAGPCDPAGRT